MTVAIGVVSVLLYNDTVLLASAVPERLGFLVLIAPVEPMRVGAEGGSVSTLKITAGDAAD